VKRALIIKWAGIFIHMGVMKKECKILVGRTQREGIN
jgi:hypothetical protein